MANDKRKWLDIASMGLSGLCVIHCLALPFLVAALPMLGVFTHNDIVHQVLILIAVPLSLWTIISSGAWRQWQVSVAVGVGLTLLAIAAFVSALEAYEVYISVAGATCVAGAHLINYLNHRRGHFHTADCACGNA